MQPLVGRSEEQAILAKIQKLRSTLIDRRDDVINLCEVKFADGEFVIDKQYAQHLRRKLDAFRRVTQTRKSLFLTMITTFGVKKNSSATDLVANQITMDDLF